jgi:hypothetical protein
LQRTIGNQAVQRLLRVQRQGEEEEAQLQRTVGNKTEQRLIVQRHTANEESRLISELAGIKDRLTAQEQTLREHQNDAQEHTLSASTPGPQRPDRDAMRDWEVWDHAERNKGKVSGNFKGGSQFYRRDRAAKGLEELEKARRGAGVRGTGEEGVTVTAHS